MLWVSMLQARTLEEKDRPVAWFPAEWSVVWITAYTRIYANSSPFRAIFEVCFKRSRHAASQSHADMADAAEFNMIVSEFLTRQKAKTKQSKAEQSKRKQK